MTRSLDRGSWLAAAGLIVLMLAVYAVAVWSMHRFPLLRWDASLGYALALCIVVTWAAGWLLKWRRELVATRGLLRSLTDPLAIALIATLVVGNPLYHILNATLDWGPISRVAYLVEQRDCFRVGKGRGPQLILRRGSDRDERVRLDVPKRVCEDAEQEQEVILEVKPGFLGSPWIARYAVQPGR